jgi:hypothetical protein
LGRRREAPMSGWTADERISTAIGGSSTTVEKLACDNPTPTNPEELVNRTGF